MDTVVRAKPTLTTGTLLVLGVMNLIDCINVSLLMPYIDSMISTLMAQPTNAPSVVHTVGVLVGFYSLCEIVFCPFWGALSDRIGRRPVLLVGLAGSAVAPVIFGMARSIQVAFLGRGLDGFFCGNVGVSKTYLGELVDETNEARGFGCLAVCFSLGLIIGPMLGGSLSNPASWAPTWFSGTIFDSHPYLLPNLTYACLAVSAWFVGWIFLDETLPDKTIATSGKLNEALLPASGDRGPRRSVDRSLFGGYSRKLVLSVLLYGNLTGYAGCWTQNFVLIVALPRSLGGFAMSPHEIGSVMNFGGFGLLLVQLFVFPAFIKRFGFFRAFAFGWILHSVVTLLLPVYALMADPEVFGTWRYLPLASMCFFGQAGLGFCFPTAFVWINRALGSSDRGSVNGVANSLGALCRALYPPFSSVLLSLGLGSSLSVGRYLPVFVMSFVGTASWCLAWFATQDERSSEGSSKR